MARIGIERRTVISTLACAVLLIACGDDGSEESSASNHGGATSEVDASMPSEDSSTPAPKNIVDTAVAAGSFKTLAKALTDTGLVDTLEGDGPFTVFAPTDDAFAKLPSGTLESLTPDQLKGILLYHVVAANALAADLDGKPLTSVAGQSLLVDLTDGVKINGAKVTTADIEASNGVIHVIDTVLLPPNVVEMAKLAGQFTTLVSALTDADLIDTLSGDGPFTVFAPTDAAFAALPSGTLDSLSKKQLTDVLLYHVVSGAVKSDALNAGAVDTLLSGKKVTVDLTSGVKINEATVVLPNVVATNGVIHVIDKVLLPE
jgi:uncharacterized surface protein with fasciclin (FAS1) repeats